MREMVYAIGRGIGQVMFQDNVLSGTLMLAGLACGSWLAALLALCGCTIGTLTACCASFDRADIRAGLYGFNGALVGIAVSVFFVCNVWTLLLLLAGAACSAVLFRWWPFRDVIPPFTAPFIGVTWLLLGFVRTACPEFLLSSPSAPFEAEADVFGAFWRHFGQVMFQGTTVWSGVLFLLAILINSLRQAAFAVGGALLPLLFVWVPADGYTVFNAGLLGYNAVLCAQAFDDRTKAGALWAAFSAVLSVWLQAVGMYHGWITLTAPFVLSVWLTGRLRRSTVRPK